MLSLLRSVVCVLGLLVAAYPASATCLHYMLAKDGGPTKKCAINGGGGGGGTDYVDDNSGLSAYPVDHSGGSGGLSPEKGIEGNIDKGMDSKGVSQKTASASQPNMCAKDEATAQRQCLKVASIARRSCMNNAWTDYRVCIAASH